MGELSFNRAWLSRVWPFEVTRQITPQDLSEILGILWGNRTALSYVWKILNHGICDGCSLGVSGLRDDLLGGVHFCMARLRLLQLHTMKPFDLSLVSDIGRLARMAPDELPALGRLGYPLIRRKDERGFLRISWDEALDVARAAIRAAAAHELAFLATSQGLTNEVYYIMQKLARVLGSNNVDLCSRVAHGASVAPLQATLGYGASTCSLVDCVATNLLVLFGTDVVADQPFTLQYLRRAKQAGARIIVVQPVSAAREPLAHRPFGRELVDDFFAVRAGGQIAFVNGVIKFLILAERIDRRFVERHTHGFAQLERAVIHQSWDMLERHAGTPREHMQRFAEAYSQSPSAVFLYGTGLAESPSGIDRVKTIVNLALARGMIGREGCGIMAIRGDSGVQGSGECGFEAGHFPGGFAVADESARRFSNLWHYPVPSRPGLPAPAMIDAAQAGKIKFLYTIGGNLLDTVPDSAIVANALERIPVRVHQDLTLNPSMLLDAQETVLLLPAQTRYEQLTGGTSTSTERRVRFTPEIPGRRVAEALPQWEIPVRLGRKAVPGSNRLFPFSDTRSIREEMSRVMPIYRGVEKLSEEGDQLQWGGPQLYRDGFSMMPTHRALFTAVEPVELECGKLPGKE